MWSYSFKLVLLFALLSIMFLIRSVTYPTVPPVSDIIPIRTTQVVIINDAG